MIHILSVIADTKQRSVKRDVLWTPGANASDLATGITIFLVRQIPGGSFDSSRGSKFKRDSNSYRWREVNRVRRNNRNTSDSLIARELKFSRWIVNDDDDFSPQYAFIPFPRVTTRAYRIECSPTRTNYNSFFFVADWKITFDARETRSLRANGTTQNRFLATRTARDIYKQELREIAATLRAHLARSQNF